MRRPGTATRRHLAAATRQVAAASRAARSDETLQPLHNGAMRPRLIAAQVALEEGLPGIALQFIAGIDPANVKGASRDVQKRMRELIAAGRKGHSPEAGSGRHGAARQC